MKIKPLKILGFLASQLDSDEKICSSCGEVFNISSAEWLYNNYWNDQHEDFNYGIEYPDMDLCDECAIEDTEDRYF